MWMTPSTAVVVMDDEHGDGENPNKLFLAPHCRLTDQEAFWVFFWKFARSELCAIENLCVFPKEKKRSKIVWGSRAWTRGTSQKVKKKNANGWLTYPGCVREKTRNQETCCYCHRWQLQHLKCIQIVTAERSFVIFFSSFDSAFGLS